jgi:hypothetical protein
MPKEFTLSKPIKVHGQNGVEDTNKVTLQDPPSSLIFEYGMPFSFVQLPDDYGRPRMGGEDNRVNGPIMQRWLSRLVRLGPWRARPDRTARYAADDALGWRSANRCW